MFFPFSAWNYFCHMVIIINFRELAWFLEIIFNGDTSAPQNWWKIGILNPKTWKIELIDPERNFLGRIWLWGYFEHRNAEVKFYACLKLIWFPAESDRAPLSGQESSPGTHLAARALIVIFDIFPQPENKIMNYFTINWPTWVVIVRPEK